MAWGPRLTAGEFSFCAAPASLFISSSPCTVDGARGLKRVVFGGRPAPFTVTAEAAAGHPRHPPSGSRMSGNWTLSPSASDTFSAVTCARSPRKTPVWGLCARRGGDVSPLPVAPAPGASSLLFAWFPLGSPCVPAPLLHGDPQGTPAAPRGKTRARKPKPRFPSHRRPDGA